MVKKWDGQYSGLALKYFILYNREAHLDWQAKTPDERVARVKWHNKLCESVTGQQTFATMLVDDVNNKVDALYGSNSNGITIIDPQGKIIYYADWFRYGDVDEFFTNLFKKLK